MNPSTTPAQATPAQAVPAQAKVKAFRRWWYLGLPAGLILLSLLLLIGYVYASSQAAWRAAEEETSRNDPRWRLLEIEADRPAIPDAENSALLISTLPRKGKSLRVWDTPHYEKIFANLPAATQMNEQQIQLLRNELGKITQPLAEARQLKDMPRGRFPTKFNDDFISTLMTSHQETHIVTAWLQHDAWLLAHDEQMGPAVDSCRAALNTGRTMAGEPFLIAHLIRVAIQTIALTSLERVLAQGEVPEEALQSMQALIEMEMNESSNYPAMRGERAGFNYLFTNVRSGKVQTTQLRGITLVRRASTLTEWIHDLFPYTLLRYYPEHLLLMNRVVEIAKLPLHERDAKLQEYEESVKRSTNPVVKLSALTILKMHQAECRSQALLRCALVAVACERYRHKHTRWPDALQVLVEEKWLSALPVGPMDNQPLRYRRRPDGIVIYSIGLDRVDNQGHLDRERELAPGVDLGFQLWDVRLRRQPPLPPVALSDAMEP